MSASARDALERLEARYGAGRVLSPEQATFAPLRALEHDEKLRRALGEAEPSGQDMLDGLTQVPLARSLINHNELRLIHQARERGETWQSIGLALGEHEGKEARFAQRRYQQLLEMYPGFGARIGARS